MMSQIDRILLLSRILLSNSWTKIKALKEDARDRIELLRQNANLSNATNFKDLSLDRASNLGNASLDRASDFGRHLIRPERRLTTAWAAFICFMLVATITVGFQQSAHIHLQYPEEVVEPEPLYDETKVALLIENRPMDHLIPLLLHFTSTIPPEWRVRFMGSDASVAFLERNPAIRSQVTMGKMDLTLIPSNMSVSGQEEISQFLTNRWVYETLLAPAEHLLMFQTDSILCSNSNQTLNDWLEYDWVGAPWWGSGTGGNGGLSLRKVSSLVRILTEHQRPFGVDAWEDQWLVERLREADWSTMADATIEVAFSGETTRSVRPLGYHTGGGGEYLHGVNFGTPELRKEAWDYCPEFKMMIPMDAEVFVPGECNSIWKRDGGDDDSGGGLTPVQFRPW